MILCVQCFDANRFNFHRKKSGDIQEILACGNISEGDLHFLEMLGSGNCGTVYK